MAQQVNVKEFDLGWKALFEKEAELIRSILGDSCKAVHHIGSTAVDGLPAKPIIDILTVVDDIEAVDKLIPQFEAAGYEYLGELGLAERRYLRKGGIERTHLLQIYAESCSFHIERHLAVRDYLRSNKEIAEEYGALKTRLAKKFPNNNEAYCDGKDGFVDALERAALKWRHDSCDWESLYSAATQVHNKRALSKAMVAGEASAALLTESGSIYAGVSISLCDGAVMCAEKNAAANMITHGEQRISKLIVLAEEGEILTPCGACKEFLVQIDPTNENAEVLVSYEGKKAVCLKAIVTDR